MGKMIIKSDERGRIYIPKKYLRKLPGEFYLVETANGLLLVPIPKNAVEELEKIGVNMPDLSLSELREEILKQAAEETAKK